MLGMARARAQDLAGGLEELGKAVALNPSWACTRSTAAPCSKPAIAIAQAEFEAELARNPLDFDAHLYLGVSPEGGRGFDEGMAHFERALGVRPGDPGVRYQMVTIYVSRGETDRALPLLEAIVKEAPAFLEHVTLATVYYRLKRREDGDRERAIVDALNKEIQAQPGAVAPNTPETRRCGRHDSPTTTTALVLAASLAAVQPRRPATAGRAAGAAGLPHRHDGGAARHRRARQARAPDPRPAPGRDHRPRGRRAARGEVVPADRGRALRRRPVHARLGHRRSRSAAPRHARVPGVRPPRPERPQAGAEGGAGLFEEAAPDRAVGGGVLARQPAAHAAGLLAQRRRVVRGGRSRDDVRREGGGRPAAGGEWEQAGPVRRWAGRGGVAVNPATAGADAVRSRCAR